jgi:hypothetical protein
MKPDISLATKTGHFNLLPTAGPSKATLICESPAQGVIPKSPRFHQRGEGSRVGLHNADHGQDFFLVGFAFNVLAYS